MAPTDPPTIRDYEFLASLLLETVRERSPQKLPQKLVHRVLEEFGIIMVVWLGPAWQRYAYGES